MPDPNVNAVHQIRIIGTNHAGVTANVLHFGQTVAVFDDPTALQTFLTNLANAVKECVVDVLLPGLSSDWTFVKIQAQQILPVRSDTIEVTADAGSVGELDANSEPGFVAQLVSVKTGLASRRKRGRFYLPPPPESGVDKSSLTAGQLALIAAFCACLAGKFIGAARTFADAHLGVYSRTATTGGATMNEAFTGASQLVPSVFVARMGSRKQGLGA